MSKTRPMEGEMALGIENKESLRLMKEDCPFFLTQEYGFLQTSGIDKTARKDESVGETHLRED